MNKRILAWGIVAVVALLSYGGYAAWRAQRNLVTLDVRDMDVRKVVSKIQWQTWERILVHKEIEGKVTLKVERVPLEEVLTIISDQLSLRWSRLYPLYTKGDSLVAFKKAVRGDVDPASVGWTNLQTRMGGRGFGGPGGGFGDIVRGQNNLVNLKLDNKDLDFTLLALARFSQARLVPENGTSGNIKLQLEQVPYQQAVASVAKQVNRKWEQFYALQPGFGFGRDGGPGGRDFARNDGDGRGEFGRGEFGRRRGDGTNQVETAEEREARRDAEREKMREAQLATMTAEEQKKQEEERARWEAIRNLPEAEREKAFAELRASPEFQQRQQAFQQRQMNQLKNSTPEQRAERYKQRMERQQRWQQTGGGQGGRGPGR